MAGPGGVEVGRASVRVLPDTSSFPTALQRYLDRVERRLRIEIPTQVDTTGLDADLDRVRRKTQAHPAEVPVRPVVEEFARRARADVTAAVRGIEAHIPLTPEGEQLRRDIAAKVKAVEDTLVLDVPVDLDNAAAFRSQVRALVAEVEAIAAKADPTVTVEVDIDRGALAQLRGLVAAGRQLLPTKRALTGVAAGIAGVRAALGTGLKVATISALGVAAAGASVNVINLAASLSAAAGAVAVLPAALGAAAAAMGALKIGTIGFADAVKAIGDPDALAEAMKRLAPAARETVRALRDLRPAFNEMRLPVQQALFTGLGKSLTTLARTYLPVLGQSFGIIAARANDTARAVAAGLVNPQAVNAVRQVLGSAAEAFSRLTQPAAAFVKSLLTIAQVGSGFLPGMASTVAALADRFSRFIAEAAKTGQLQEFIRGGLAALSDLASVAGSAARIIGGIVSAAQDVGGGGLATLAGILREIADVINGPAFQEGLRTFFAGVLEGAGAISSVFPAIGEAVANLAPVFSVFVSEVSGVVATLLSTLAGALGDPAVTAALTSIVTALGGALQALAPIIPVIAQAFVALAPALSAIANTVGSVLASALKALSPLLIMVAEYLGKAFQISMPLISLIAELAAQLISALLPAIQPILDVLLELAPVLADMLTQALKALMPGLMAIIDAVVEIVPLFADLLMAIVPLIPAITPLIATLLRFNAMILAVALKALVPVIGWLIKFATAVTKWLVKPLTSVIGFLTKWIGKAIEPFQRFYDKVVGHSIIPDLVRGVVAWLKGLPGKALAAIASLPGKVIGVMTDLAGRARDTVTRMVSSVVQRLAGLPGKAAEALGSLKAKVTGALKGIGSWLLGAGAKLIQGLIDGITSKMDAVAAAAGKVAQRVKDFWPGSPVKKGPLRAWNNGKAGRRLMDLLVKGINDSRAKVVAAVKTVTKEVAKTADRQAVAIAKTAGARLAKWARSRDSVVARLERAQDKLKDLQASARDYAAQIRDSILSFGDITRAETDGPRTLEQITAQLRAAVKTAVQFATTVGRLRKAGLNKVTLDQILQAGPEAGLATAQAIAAGGPEAVKEINRLTQQLGTAAKIAGKTGADAMYAAGISAAEGLVKGLKARRNEITEVMERIARDMIKAIKRELKVRSPSAVMRDEVGAQIGLGIAAGIDSTAADIRSALLSAVAVPSGIRVPDLARTETKTTTTREVTINQYQVGDQSPRRMVAALRAVDALAPR